MSDKNVIPPMTDPMSKYWDQPNPNDILVDDTHALMSQTTFEKLAEYSCSKPSGVYPGKMWKRHDGAFDPRCKSENCRWMLVWFGFSDKGEDYCSNNYRLILLA